MDAQGEWNNGLFSQWCGGDCGTCWGAWCCPCFLFGRADQRLEKFPDMNKDHFSLFNGACCIQFAAAYVHLAWVPVMIKRQEFRQKFGIKGDGCNDCLVSYFCHCCALSQMDMEAKERAAAAQGMTDVKSNGYSQQGGMVYQPGA